MALETLKDVNRISEFEISRINGYVEGVAKTHPPIVIDDEFNSIVFTIQNGSIKENGVNGCQVDTIIETTKLIIEGLNKKFPCRENSMVITKLDKALMWLNKRKQDRVNRGVEGLNKA